jgi:hypothetical protein
MLLSRDQACNWPSSTTPLSTAAVSSSQSLAAALQAAVNQAQAAFNSILTRSPADFASFGPVVQADVAVSNAQNQSPGVVPPGSAIPSAFQSLTAGVPSVQWRRAGPANQGRWGGGARRADAGGGFRAGLTWPDGSPVNASTHGGPASRPAIANADGYRGRRQSFQMGTGLGPGGMPGPSGPVAGAAPSGFLGRGETCAVDSAPVDTSPIYGPPNPPAPPLTMESPVSAPAAVAAAAPAAPVSRCAQPSGNICLDIRNGLVLASQVSPSVLYACSQKGYAGNCPSCSTGGPQISVSDAELAAIPMVDSSTLGPCPGAGLSGYRRGMGGAYAVSVDTCPGGGDVNAGGAAPAADSGFSPLWWLLAAGVVVWAMSASDAKPAKKTYTRRAA